VRIFQVCADPGIAPDGTKGGSIHLRSIGTALTRAGHEVTLFTARPPRSAEGFPFAVRPVESLLDSGGADVVYERYALGRAEGLHAARALGCPFALEVNAPLVREAIQHRPETVTPGDDRVERELFTAADLVVAVSGPLRRYAARMRGTLQGTAVVPNGCDAERYPVAAAVDGGEPNTVVFLGHPKPWHGAGSLPELIGSLRRRGRDVRLLVVGGGPGGEAIAERARELGVGDLVTVTGAVSPEEAARRVLEGTVAVAPYPRIPLFYFCPLKVVECMAAGLPVVATRQGDIPRILGDAGVLVPPGDPAALADAVDGLLGDDAARSAMGARGRARALGEYTWDAAARRLTSLLEATVEEAVA